MHLQLSLLIFATFFYNTVSGKVIISGKISGYDGKSIVYYNPTIEGIFTPYWKEIKPTGNGTFKIEFENEGYGNTRVTYKKISYRFFHDTNSKIYFDINDIKSKSKTRITGARVFLFSDSLKQITINKITGDYEAVNRFYNKNLRSSYFTTQMVDGNYYSNLIFNCESTSSALALLDSLMQIELAQINQLPNPINIETSNAEIKAKEIQDFLVNEVHAFYGAIFLNGMFLKRKDHVIKTMVDSTAKPDVYNHEWEVLIERLSEQTKKNLRPIPNSPDYIDFMESMAYTLSSYKQYNFPQNPTRSLDDELTNRLFKYDTSLFFNKNARFAYELSGVQRFLNDQLFYSPALLHAIYDLQSKYPTSSHFQFYEEKIETLKNSLFVSKQEFKKAKIIRSNFNSFDDLVKRFIGKNILIDIWATWCHPCVEEFKYKGVIQPFIENDKIEMLYISIDKPQWEDRWQQSIKINELQGNHFRADKKFIDDMWTAIGDYKGAIPRYVLVNKEGEIIQRTAARPSNGNELIRQIESMVN
jgi:thiol-disulfide isomerase/thioredoxin